MLSATGSPANKARSMNRLPDIRRYYVICLQRTEPRYSDWCPVYFISLYAKFCNHLISFELHDPLLDRKWSLWHGTTLQAAAAIPVLFNWIRSDPFNWTRTGARRLHFCINLDTFSFLMQCYRVKKKIKPSSRRDSIVDRRHRHAAIALTLTF